MKEPKKGRYFTLAAMILIAAPASAGAATFYVQAGAPNGNGSQSRPWGDIASANTVVRPGDMVVLHSGEYVNDPIAPARSGSQGQYITYRAADGAQPVITDVRAEYEKTAVDLDGRSWIRIDGIIVDGKRSFPDNNLNTWIRMVGSHFNLIENSTFLRARGWSGILMDGGASFNILRNNRFEELGTVDTGQSYDPPKEDYGDVLDLRTAHNNLIEDNEFIRAGHNLFDVRGYYNVLRRNIFDNDWGGGEGNRIGELSGNFKDGVTGLRGFNLFEENIVRGARAAGDNPSPPAMKVQGQSQIVRRNLFFDHIATAILSEVRNPPIDRAINNHIFHNEFDRVSDLWQLLDYGTEGPSHGNVWKNNAIGTLRLQPAIQISITDSNIEPGNDHYNGNRFVGNAFADEAVTITVVGTETVDLRTAESQYPSSFSGNSTGNSDALADTGAPLTKVVSESGQGDVISVADAGYFSDGFDLIPGDRIRVGGNAAVVVKTVDYELDTLTLGSQITWTKGDPVNLDYEGIAPDIGAHEGETTTAVPPDPPLLIDP